ncbi:MAG: AAA family ATPase [Desulfobacteraceae bacterium]|jgi:hypothetical protein
MIKSIQLNNLQSHENTSLDLHPGINAIRGESDQGKTAILRGLYWVITNRPAGNVLISHWARDAKGNVETESSVTLEVDRGKVTRFKTKDENGYKIGDRDLTAIGMDVPIEVPETLNFSESAVHRQMDGPFLLSDSPGEVARYLNKVLKLDIIDKTLSNVESRKRTINAQLKIRESDIKETEEQLASYDWVEKASRILERILAMEERREAAEELRDEMLHTVNVYQGISEELEHYDQLDKAQNLIQVIYDLMETRSHVKNDRQDLATGLGFWEGLTEDYEQYKDLKKAEKDVTNLDRLLTMKKDYKNLRAALLESRANYAQLKIDRKELGSLIEELYNQMPDTCPLCGGAL